MHYGRALKTVRGARDLTQKELAELCGMDASTVSLIESGNRIPNASTINTICRGLEVPQFLFTFLASDPEDLRGVTPEQATMLGGHLLRILRVHSTP